MKFLVIITAITFTYISCKGQKKTNQLNTKTMTHKLDTFDISAFDKNKHSEMLQYDFYLENGNFVQQSESKVDYTEKTTKKENKYSAFKSYYKSGKLMSKAMLYDGNLIVGEYTKYNEDGEIIEVRNYDKYYSFTLEDVLKYCKENNLVEKDIPGVNKKTKITLTRTNSYNLTENDAIEWQIMYGVVPYIPKESNTTYNVVLLYILDGRTGKEMARKYKRIKLDKKWTIIED